MITEVLRNPSNILSRRKFLGLLSGAVIAPFIPGSAEAASPADRLLTHSEYLSELGSYIEATERMGFINQFKNLMLQTNNKLVSPDGWIVPSPFYPQLFSRDSFWALAARRDRDLSQLVVNHFRDDQRNNGDGHIATAIYRDGARPENRDRDEESTMMYVLNSFVLHDLGGEVDLDSLNRAYGNILQHMQNGRFVTQGERRFADSFGAYHTWADTLKSGPGVMTYNQGLICVTLRALEEMGVPINQALIVKAEENYRNMSNPVKPSILPQREGSTIIDVSALVGESLSLYLFDRSILGSGKVEATINHLVQHQAVFYANGSFLGFKVLSDFSGQYLPVEYFIVPELNSKGNYQNGGTWMLYDTLALYSAMRHGVQGSKELFLQRLKSEYPVSHEFMRTDPGHKETAEQNRDDYGWNTFAVNLLP